MTKPQIGKSSVFTLKQRIAECAEGCTVYSSFDEGRFRLEDRIDEKSLLSVVIIIHPNVRMIEAIGSQRFPEDAVNEIFRSFVHTRLLGVAG